MLGHLAVEELGLLAVVGALIVGIVWAVRRGSNRGGCATVGEGRGPHRGDWCLLGGVGALVIAVSGPVDRYADQLFWVHMAQHVVLLTVAAPLIALGTPWRFVPRAVATRWSAWIGSSGSATGIARSAVIAWVVFNLAFLAFHLPVLYDAALEHLVVHLVEHAVFLATAVWFWAVALDARSFRTGPAELWRAGYVLAAAGVGWVLAIILTFAPEPLYREYADLGRRPGGITALADQQLAAGVMLVPGSITFLIVAGIALARWLGNEGPEAAPHPPVSQEEVHA